MTIWHNSKMSTFYYSDEPSSEDYPCIVEINEDKISVKYDDEEVVEYQGKNHGNGHFELSAPEIGGKASLHMFPNSLILEGYWIEDSYRGMWRILLA